MKTFGQLTEEQQDTAINNSMKALVYSLVEGFLEVKLANPARQGTLDSMLNITRKMNNKTLAYACIVEMPSLREEFNTLARMAAEMSEYTDLGELTFKVKE